MSHVTINDQWKIFSKSFAGELKPNQLRLVKRSFFAGFLQCLIFVSNHREATEEQQKNFRESFARYNQEMNGFQVAIEEGAA